MKQLIICEKPSLARNVARAIGGMTKYDAYYENAKYIVTFVFGHIFTLKSIEGYTGKTGKWKYDDLPYIPHPFEFVINADCEKQYREIQKLHQRDDVEAIVNCGDADREGEIIIRNVLNELHNKKPVYRLWLPEQTDESIRNQLENMKLDSEYDNLAAEGYARTYTDWLYGINLTRYVSLKGGRTLHVGRVAVPIIKAIYDRDLEIKNFKVSKYYEVAHAAQKDEIDYKITCKEKYEKEDEARDYVNVLNDSNLFVSDVTKKVLKRQRPRLFSLSGLQGALGSDKKLPATAVLSAVQSLYEKGFVSYPRTNTEYLAENEKNKISEIIKTLKLEDCDTASNPTLFDDSKIESHSGLTITTKALTGDVTDIENIVYEAIYNRFCAAFCKEDCMVEQTVVSFVSEGNEEFKLKGNTIVREGFLKYDGKSNANIIPVFEKGEVVDPCFKPVEKETTPPKHYTTKTLMDFLKNPFKKEKVEQKDLFEGVEIGTEATRTGIIENAKHRGYIKEVKGAYYIEDLGVALIDTINSLKIDLYKEKSVEINKMLKSVYHNELSIDEVVSYAAGEITEIIEADVQIEKVSDTVTKIGDCPWCGEPVYENEKAYSCSAWRTGCKFALWKNDRYFASLGKKVSKTTAQDLLRTGKTHLTGLVSKTSGKKYNADILVEWEHPFPKYKMEFPKSYKKGESA